MTKRYFPLLILWTLILAFTLYFSWYTIQRYETLHAYTADLSLIDQAMWNTLHGRFMEATWGNHQQPRLAEHFEPLLVPLSALFWLWDDVRILLIVQSFALALGALPVYWLAEAQFKIQTCPEQSQRDAKFKMAGETHFAFYSLPFAFVILYLLSPPLQAAAVADFHADPFAVAPFLFAFWYAAQRRWNWMWFWAIVVMLIKENMPTLVAMLGLYLVVRDLRLFGGRRSATIRHSSLVHGLSLIVVGTAWFLIATFGIVAPLARKYFGSAGPVYLSSRFSINFLEWFYLLREPARLKYLLGLLATTGGLALLAPQYLLLGLPVFIANTFSAFPGQYSGEQHYSAPLVAVLVIAAIYGGQKVSGFRFWVSGFSPRTAQYAKRLVFVLALLVALGYHCAYGWTPLSRRAETYAVSPHTQTLPRFLAQIPADVPVSASAAVHPHLAHRPVAYTFPIVEDAQYILVDVTDVPGVHPNDVRAQLEGLLASGQWQLLDAANGFVLLQKSPVDSPQKLPADFYTFVYPPAGPLEYPLDITFDNNIRLLGFDLLDNPFHQQTAIRLYWQALQPNLPADLRLWPQFYNDDGRPLNNPLAQPSIETLWYPPSNWQNGQIIAAQTLPANLGDTFHLAVAVIHGNNPAKFSSRLPVSNAAHPHDQNTWATVASFKRGNWALNVLPPALPLESLAPLDIPFTNGLNLTGLRITNDKLQMTNDKGQVTNDAGQIVLSWQTNAPLPLDYTIFIHFLDVNGNTVAQIDAQPEWVFPLPTSRWKPDERILTGHSLPSSLPPGTYQLQLGLYNWQSLERLPLQAGSNAVIIGEISVQ